MSDLCVGFSRVTITPMMGIGISGYYKTRIADGVLDDLEANVIVLSCGEEKAALISLDILQIKKDAADAFAERISEVTGIAEEAVFISCTHTHTGPFLVKDSEDELEQEYFQMVRHKIADAVSFAVADLKPAKMGWGIGQAPNIAFIRRFRMKDGTIRTNPGVDNPDIVEPIGAVDERVSVVRFDRQDGETVILVNFANHPDTVGGCKISADWPGFLRRTVEKTLDNTRCVFFNGAQGDVNHVNVHPRGGYLNDMFIDFDDVARGYGHTRYMGRVVAGGVLQAYDKVKYVEADSLKYLQKVIRIPSNMPLPEEMEEAYYIDRLHQAGKDDELPYKGMMLTTMVAGAARKIRLEHGPEAFDMNLSGLAIGDVALVGIPGEPFNGVGKGLKDMDLYELVLPVCCTNGCQGYFPMKEAYDEGGYEANSSSFRAGVAELIIEEGKKLLEEMR